VAQTHESSQVYASRFQAALQGNEYQLRIDLGTKKAHVEN
jgi:hypothetical protein